MKRVVFFTEPEWAFGQIHFSLMKYLFTHRISCEVLNFFKQYDKEEMKRISENTDLFITTPVGAAWLIQYGVIPVYKIRCVIHAKWDHYLGDKLFNEIGIKNYTQFFKIATVSKYLSDDLFGRNSKIPILHLGVESNRYKTPIAESHKVKRVGYAGSLQSYNFFGEEIKRGKLVNDICDELGLEFITPGGKYHYLSMPEFYKNIDCLVVSSTEEGFGLPIIEAGMSGKMVFSTKVGILYDLFEEVKNGPVPYILLETGENNFKKSLKKELLKYSEMSSVDRLENSNYIRWFSENLFDWPEVINPWVNFIMS